MSHPVLALYRALPFKRPFCFALRSVVSPGKRIYRKLTFNGVFTVKVDDKHQFKIHNDESLFIEKCLFWKGLYGEWEKNSLKAWTALSRTSEYIFDVGANTGVYSLLSQSVNPGGKIYAFEPARKVHTRLKANVALNGYPIHCCDMAVSNENGHATFYDHDTDYSTTASLKSHEVGEKNSAVVATKVRVTTLDSFMAENNIPRADLIKIDVETFEVQVLEGFAQTLRRDKPAILVEVLNNDVAQGILRLIDGLGYEYYSIDENHGITKTDTIRRNKSYNYLLCQPGRFDVR